MLLRREQIVVALKPAEEALKGIKSDYAAYLEGMIQGAFRTLDFTIEEAMPELNRSNPDIDSSQQFPLRSIAWQLGDTARDIALVLKPDHAKEAQIIETAAFALDDLAHDRERGPSPPDRERLRSSRPTLGPALAG